MAASMPWCTRGVAALASLGRRGGAARLAAPGAARHVRTGFFTDDPDYLDPEAPLLAERVDSRWRHMDDATLSASVLERSNVGMGMLVLNRPSGLDLPTINTAYKRLRNLEVNSLKRFVGFTASEPGPFCLGLDPRELLLAATAGVRHGRLPQFSRALLWHHQELAHLIADYRKPLVVQLSGPARNGGAALACLANFSGAYRDSEVVVDACFNGLVPDGGMTYVLARLQWNLGEFLALTGWPVRGADLVYAGLVQHWLSPDALPFLELTSEKQLEVSESDARMLLNEHSLALPEGLTEQCSLPRGAVPLIADAFSRASVPEIAERLRSAAERGEASLRGFAAACLRRLSGASPLALHVALRLVRESRRLIAEEPQPAETGAHRRARGDQGALAKVLRLELRAQQQLLCKQDAVMGLHAACLGRRSEEEPGVLWSRAYVDVPEDEADDVLGREASLEADFAVAPRPELPLSRHPRLRRYHPDFDPATGLDHDPAWMAAEVRRWSPDLFQEERRRVVEELLGDRDPALYGLSRWVRVESRA
uniref:3-hydroxyisobutyryl-CoA hydrolase n=1 Tax=Alexandrium monilatum TaxID=311494 RepID=A0A7S4Q6C0_9DINO